MLARAYISEMLFSIIELRWDMTGEIHCACSEFNIRTIIIFANNQLKSFTVNILMHCKCIVHCISVLYCRLSE